MWLGSNHEALSTRLHCTSTAFRFNYTHLSCHLIHLQCTSPSPARLAHAFCCQISAQALQTCRAKHLTGGWSCPAYALAELPYEAYPLGVDRSQVAADSLHKGEASRANPLTQAHFVDAA